MPNQWHRDSLVNFTFHCSDTVSVNDLFIRLRNNKDYEYSNLFLISTIKYPSGKINTDTLEYQMSKPNGEFLGTGFTDVRENKLWYKENIVFPEWGKYEISISHAMRENGQIEGLEKLNGVFNVGLSIEKK